MKKSKFTEQQIAFTLKQADRRPDQPALSKRIREMARRACGEVLWSDRWPVLPPFALDSERLQSRKHMVAGCRPKRCFNTRLVLRGQRLDASQLLVAIVGQEQGM
jgi:hypothetical protein